MFISDSSTSTGLGGFWRQEIDLFERDFLPLREGSLKGGLKGWQYQWLGGGGGNKPTGVELRYRSPGTWLGVWLAKLIPRQLWKTPHPSRPTNTVHRSIPRSIPTSCLLAIKLQTFGTNLPPFFSSTTNHNTWRLKGFPLTGAPKLSFTHNYCVYFTCHVHVGLTGM